MPENASKKHIHIKGYSKGLEYKYPRPSQGTKFNAFNRNRSVHGNRILRQLEQIKDQFNIPEEVVLPDGIVRDDAIYVEFISEWGFRLKFESLDQDSERFKYQLLNIREEARGSEGNEEYRYFVTLMMTQGGVSQFIKKVERYLNENIFYKGEDTGNAKNYALINNIQIIQRATLKSFWADSPEIPFPDEAEDIWWEVWFRKTNNDDEKINEVIQNLKATGVLIGLSELIFAEHRVRLVKGTAQQLSQSLLLLDNLAELRKPQEIADFINHKDVTYSDKKEWLEDLTNRVENHVNENSILICLLDSGVNNQHPLISPFLPDERLYSYKPEDWGKYDGEPNGGHGTGMACLSLYGDLVDGLASRDQIQIFHGLESYKLIQNNDPNDSILYGAITEEACNTPIVDRPNNLRVFCMSVTYEGSAFKGRPSAWSAAVDKITFGSVESLEEPQLFIQSGGNVVINNHDEYPSKNHYESIHDPSQSYNALTIGSYTRKDRIDPNTGYVHLAPNGAMAPSNSTSIF